jgi:hypothetical protein
MHPINHQHNHHTQTRRLKAAAPALAASVLPHLNDPNPLTSCWPLLTAEGASHHPSWLQLGVAVLEAAAAQGPAVRQDGKFKEAAGQLLQHVRMAVRVPQLAEWEAWRLEAAAEQVS